MGKARLYGDRDIVPRWDNSAGVDYMAGIDLRRKGSVFLREDNRYNLDAQAIGVYLLFEQSQSAHETDRNIIANTAFGQAANFHDVYYWYAFDLRDRAAEQASKVRWDQLSPDQMVEGHFLGGDFGNQTLAQIAEEANDVLYEADVFLIRTAMTWWPVSLIDKGYREAAIEGFLLKIAGYGEKYRRDFESKWSDIHALDPMYQRSNLWGKFILAGVAAHWKYTKFENLVTLPLSRQEMGFFTRHLTRLSNLEQPDYDKLDLETGQLPQHDVLPVPVLDQSAGMPIWRWTGILGGKLVTKILNAESRVFEEMTSSDNNGILESIYTARPQYSLDVKNKWGYFESAYEWSLQDLVKSTTQSGIIQKPRPVIVAQGGENWRHVYAALTRRCKAIMQAPSGSTLRQAVLNEIKFQRP